jgi:hypothetical protein
MSLQRYRATRPGKGVRAVEIRYPEIHKRVVARCEDPDVIRGSKVDKREQDRVQGTRARCADSDRGGVKTLKPRMCQAQLL